MCIYKSKQDVKMETVNTTIYAKAKSISQNLLTKCPDGKPDSLPVTNVYDNSNAPLQASASTSPADNSTHNPRVFT